MCVHSEWHVVMSHGRKRLVVKKYCSSQRSDVVVIVVGRGYRLSIRVITGTKRMGSEKPDKTREADTRTC